MWWVSYSFAPYVVDSRDGYIDVPTFPAPFSLEVLRQLERTGTWKAPSVTLGRNPSAGAEGGELAVHSHGAVLCLDRDGGTINKMESDVVHMESSRTDGRAGV